MAQQDLNKDPIILIDGSSYLYRAYHALPPLMTSTNQPTRAIRGVISMIRRVLQDHPSSPLAVIFDAKGKHLDTKCIKTIKPTDLLCLQT